MTLFKKELARVIISLMFLAGTAGTVIFAVTQAVLPPDSLITLPQPDQPEGSFGMKESNDPALIMPQALSNLYSEYMSNNYVTYPNGFIKYVSLNREDRAKMDIIMAGLLEDPLSSPKPQDDINSNLAEIEITGESFTQNPDGSFQVIETDDPIPSYTIYDGFELKKDITWERFLELTGQVDLLLGGGSSYSEHSMISNFGQVPVTYEEALADYNLIVSNDKFSGAHARLFSDYMGVVMALLPVFPAVFLCMKDRKRIAQVIQTRQVSSLRLVLIRFAALVLSVMIPLLLMGTVLTFIHASDYGLGAIDLFAYYKYSLLWIMPTALVSIAAGMFLTTLTGTPAAVAVMAVWWFNDMMGDGTITLVGVRPGQLVPRHNSLGEFQAFSDYLPVLIRNRIMFTVIAGILVLTTVLVYDLKRRGLLDATVLKSKFMPGRGKVQSEV